MQHHIDTKRVQAVSDTLSQLAKMQGDAARVMMCRGTPNHFPDDLAHVIASKVNASTNWAIQEETDLAAKAGALATHTALVVLADQVPWLADWIG